MNQKLLTNIAKMPLHKHLLIIITLLSLFSCNEQTQQNNAVSKNNDDIPHKIDTTQNKTILIEAEVDSIQISKQHKINTIKCDLDGDELDETIQIVRNSKNGKSGLRIIYGNKTKTDYLGLGKDMLNQGFDEIDWIGIFEVAPKNEIYYNNVNEEGDIISEEEVNEEDKIKLQNDGIFIHAEESCGGGIIYLQNGKYEWIQQE